MSGLMSGSAVILLPDGETETIFSHDEFAALVKEYMGDDAEQYLLELIELTGAARYKVESDFETYEAELDSMHSTLNEILLVLEKAEEILDTPRIKREELRASLAYITGQIAQCL